MKWPGVILSGRVLCMPFSPPRFRAAFALAVLFGAGAGCGTLWSDTPAPPAPATARGVDVAPPAPLPPVTAPGKYHTRRDYYVVYHDFELDKNDALFAELDPLPEQVFGELKLPPGNPMVQVFLFDTQEHYERYMQKNYRTLPMRRAYFISKPGAGRTDELLIFTWMGGYVATDLRHELTHALLRSVLKDVPIWLDEGLAGYFELPPHQEGVNPQHLDALTRSPFRPDLARLEKLTQVAQMEKPEYREAWAWVHLMLRSGPAARKVLQDYLQALRTDPKPGSLLPKLREAVPEPEQALVDHLASIEVPRPRTKIRATAPR
jgi:hypothetical protein